PQHDSSAWAHSIVWCVRDAGTGADAVLPARAAIRPCLEKWPAVIRVLVDQHRPDRHGPDQRSADWPDASVGLGGVRHVYARSAEFLHSRGMNELRWLRMIGDSIFAVGAVVLGWFVLGLVTGHSYDDHGYVAEGQWEVREEEEEELALHR